MTRQEYQNRQTQVIQFKRVSRDFPSGTAVKTLPSNAGGVGLIPGQGARIPDALWPKKKKNKTNIITFKFQ